MATADVAQALAAIAEQAERPASYERRTLACLQSRIEFDVGFFVRSSAVGPGPLDVDGETLEATRRAFPAYGREMLPVVRQASRHGVAVDQEVLGTAALHKSRVYRDFMAPQRGRCTLVAPLALRGRTLGMLVLGRRQAGFCRSAQTELRALLPTLRLCDSVHAATALMAGLSLREQEVLQYLCLGYTNGEIARACGTSVNTVRNQLQSVYRRLGATTRAEAVALALGGAP